MLVYMCVRACVHACMYNYVLCGGTTYECGTVLG